MHNINMSSEILTVAKDVNVDSYKIHLFTQGSETGNKSAVDNVSPKLSLPTRKE